VRRVALFSTFVGEEKYLVISHNKRQMNKGKAYIYLVGALLHMGAFEEMKT
jgi:hypothetical protein